MRSTLLLEARSITKDYPGTRALDNVSFNVGRGEVHALVGENGAGKSTLVKILSGATKPSSGKIFFDGEEIHLTSPRDALHAGIGTVYQELSLLPYMGIAENLFLGREPTCGVGFIRRSVMNQRAREICASVGLDVDPSLPVKELSTAERQLLEIAKGVAHGARVIFMDEPSATLTPLETGRLFEMIRKLRQSGSSVIYISHRLEEIFRIADRVTVLKDGKHVSTEPIEHFKERDSIVRLMIGREVEDDFYASPVEHEIDKTRVALRVRGLRAEKVRDVDFDLFRGEILGFAGLIGSGRTEIIRLISGADKKEGGGIQIEGRCIEIRSPKDAILHGIGFVPEDRGSQGLILGWSVLANLSLVALSTLTVSGFLQQRKEKELANKLVQRLRIKCSSLMTDTGHLSGGNQQKVVLGKWLAIQCRVLILDEPTRGIDVVGRTEIYRLLRELAREGIAVIVVSSDLPEILRLCDRIAVVSKGNITATLAREEADEEVIMLRATE